MFEQSYSSVYRHLRRGDWYAQADIGTGVTRSWIADGLQTFWPGLQVRSVLFLYCFGLLLAVSICGCKYQSVAADEIQV